MRLILIFIILYCSIQNSLVAQGGKWIWVSGDSSYNYKGHYGIKGINDVLNNPPARYQASYWTDLDGNFWMFGGVYPANNSLSVEINDLWKYDVTLKQWTWINGPEYHSAPTGNYGVQGVPSKANWPSARGYGANCWTDIYGDLWMFGGYGNDVKGHISNLNDLWKYNIKTGEWVWMSGSSTIAAAKTNYGTIGIEASVNMAGSRGECKAGWVDVFNNLWLFGGSNSSDNFNDLWRFNTSTNLWTWMKGSNIANDTGHYGKINIEDESNTPSARNSYTKWKDASGNFYVFGGGKWSECKNDIWRYNPLTNNWTWIWGSKSANNSGRYKQYCTVDSGNYPSSRYEHQSVQSIECTNNFWVFGGFPGISVTLNDLWIYNSIRNEWKWVSGKPIQDSGTYGQKNSSSSYHRISSRAGFCIWTDKQNNIWVFGGEDGNFKYKADLWMFIPDTNCVPTERSYAIKHLLPPTDTLLCPGKSASLSIAGLTNVTYSPKSNVTPLDSNTLVFAPDSTVTYSVHYGVAGCNDAGLITFTLHRVNHPVAAFETTPEKITLQYNRILQLHNSSTNYYTISWVNKGSSYSHILDTSIMLYATGKYCYSLLASNIYGCTDTVTHCVEAIDSSMIFVPNAFSPNGDGINDVFFPIALGNMHIKVFRVYDRWGELVYDNPVIPWDGMYKGRPVRLDVYVYYVEAENESDTQHHKPVFLKGDVTLLK